MSMLVFTDFYSFCFWKHLKKVLASHFSEQEVPLAQIQYDIHILDLLNGTMPIYEKLSF